MRSTAQKRCRIRPTFAVAAPIMRVASKMWRAMDSARAARRPGRWLYQEESALATERRSLPVGNIDSLAVRWRQWGQWGLEHVAGL